MDDRANVVLTILKANEAQFDALRKDSYKLIRSSDEAITVNFKIEDVYYADLGIEVIMQANKIPYDKRWSAGCSFEAGSEHHRVCRGGMSEVFSIGASEYCYASSWEKQERILMGLALTEDAHQTLHDVKKLTDYLSTRS